MLKCKKYNPEQLNTSSVGVSVAFLCAFWCLKYLPTNWGLPSVKYLILTSISLKTKVNCCWGLVFKMSRNSGHTPSFSWHKHQCVCLDIAQISFVHFGGVFLFLFWLSCTLTSVTSPYMPKFYIFTLKKKFRDKLEKC